MKHKHFQTINSTQDYIIDQLDKDSFDLVTAITQTKGKGRGANNWDSYSNSVAMSFSIEPNEQVSITPLEVAVITSKFFKNIDLKIKWPNDLLNNFGHKCGGILINLINNKAIVGLGINLGKTKFLDQDYKTRASSLFENEYTDEELKELMIKLYTFINSNRLSADQVTKEFNKLCIHINKEVTIIDEEETTGIFKKIGLYGEAYIETPEGEKKIFNGNLITK